MTHQDQLFNRVVECLESNNLKYDKDAQKHRITLNVTFHSKLNACRVILVVGETHIIQSFTVCPINASPDVYGNVVEFLTRANYGLKIGNFEFDYSDGEIRYHYGMLCDETVPSLKDVEACVLVGLQMFKRYGDGLIRNLMGFGNPEADIKEIEG